jgi:NAD-dependent dihydropyrimidine dehydrogenase PreA subunit
MPRAISQRVRFYLEDRLWLQVEIVSELEDLYGCDTLHHADLRAARRRLQHLCARLGHHTASFRLINSDTSIECKFCHAHCPVDRRTSDFPLDLHVQVVVPDPYRAQVSRWFNPRA